MGLPQGLAETTTYSVNLSNASTGSVVFQYADIKKGKLLTHESMSFGVGPEYMN